MAISDFAIAMIVLVRPISVLLSTIGTEITKRERAIVAMMASRNCRFNCGTILWRIIHG